MPAGSFLGALVSLFPCLALAAAPAPSVPDTLAGHALGSWLDAFNSGDRARSESFIKAQASWMDLDYVMRWRAETGGYDLLAIYSSDQTHVVFRVKARASPDEEIGSVKVSATEPVLVTELGLFRIPSGARFEAVRLDAAARATVVDRVSGILDDFYVFPEIGKEMSAALRRREKHGEYRPIVDGEDFARKLTEDLREVSHDKHVEVRFTLVARPADLSTKYPEDESKLRRRLAAVNCGFEKAEHLPPNIGYLKFNMFADPDICAPTASGAMTFLADSDVLILDLRDNNGGMGGMVEFIASYLFTEHTHLNDVFRRPENATKESWTLPYVPGQKFTGKPVFVLTSRRTFSAAEDLCYALKNLKRATLIGETTGGGAHPVEPKRIDGHFSVIVPTGRSISPITKTDWEGTGVEPDVKVSAAEALDVAQKFAAEEISKGRSNVAGDR
jgi:retinol-binding protein 3